MTTLLPGRVDSQTTSAEAAPHDVLSADAVAALGSLPQEVRTPLGENQRGAPLYAISRVGTTAVYLTRGGQNQVTRDYVGGIGERNAYHGPQARSGR